MMVAIGILGIGLTMVACFFPVALYQHADTTAQQTAMRLTHSARNIILNDMPPGRPGLDGAYLSYLTDYIPPVPPGDSVEYVWYPFAREVQGITQYMVAVCRVLPGQRFLHFPDPASLEAAEVGPTPRPFGGAWPLFFGLLLEVRAPRELGLIDVFQGAQPWSSGGLRWLVPPGSKLISKKTGLTYAVVDVDVSGPPNTHSLTLREELAPEESTALIPLASFIFFPPPVTAQLGPVDWSTVQYGDKSSLIMVLSF